MKFSAWLLCEEVKGIRELLAQGAQIVDWGMIAGWHVYSAVPSKSPKIVSLNDYQSWKWRQLTNAPMVQDPMVDYSSMTLAKRFREARQKLSYLGFSMMGGNMIVGDTEKLGSYVGRSNPITGGGVGGYASSQQHISMLHGVWEGSSNIPSVSTIVHEHAHQYWENVMSQENKQKFKDWYGNNVIKRLQNMNVPHEMLPKLDMDDVMERAPSGNDTFMMGLFQIAGLPREWDLVKLSDFALAKNDQDRIIEIIPFWGNKLINAKAKTDFTLSNEFRRGQTKKVHTGDTVRVFVSHDPNKYIITDNDNFDFIVNKSEIKDYLQFSKELLNPEQLEKLDTLSQKFTGDWRVGKKRELNIKIKNELFNPEHSKEINELFKETSRMVKFLWNNNMVSLYSIIQNVEHAHFNVMDYSQDINIHKGLFSDLVKIVLNDYGSRVPDEVIDTVRQDMPHAIGSPRGKELRNLSHEKGLIHSAYGAANVDELFATTVEHAAENLSSVSKDLLQLLYSIVR